jgi:hypothetical protein
MRGFYKGKYTYSSFDNPEPLARCDYSGLMCRHDEMVKQMEYNATGLYWTGYMVNPRFADLPQPHHLMPPVKIDPEPVMLARPGPLIVVDEIELTTIDVSGNTNVVLTSEQFAYNNFIFEGILTGNVIVFLPNVFNEFSATNNTTGDFNLSVQIQNLSYPNITLPENEPLYIASTGYTLQIVILN